MSRGRKWELREGCGLLHSASHNRHTVTVFAICPDFPVSAPWWGARGLGPSTALWLGGERLRTARGEKRARERDRGKQRPWPPRPPALPFGQVGADQRYFCFEAFRQMLGAEFWLEFLAAHATDRGRGGQEIPLRLPRVAVCPGRALDPDSPPRKRGQAVAEAARTQGLRKRPEAPGGPGWARPAGVGRRCWVPLEGSPSSPDIGHGYI